MVYQVIVDGNSIEVKASISHYSLEKDNRIREQIICHFLDDEGAESVEIKTTAEEVRNLYK